MIRALLIITAEHLASARALATVPPFSLSEAEAQQMFVPAGSPTGDAPATHFWASGAFDAATWQALQDLAAALPWAEAHQYDLETQPAYPYNLLATLGLQPMKPPPMP